MTEQTAVDTMPTHCSVCGQKLLFRAAGRDRCHQHQPPEVAYAELRGLVDYSGIAG